MDVSGDPFWIVSKIVDGHEKSGLKDKACVLFSFPVAGQQIVIREVVVKITRAFTVGTTLELGTYTLATDSVETGGVATAEHDDAYIEVADITPTIVGYYYPTTGDFADARGSGVTVGGSNLIVGASTSVPAVVLTPKISTIIIGQAQVLMLVCIVPGS
jgi:hypothetical protein